VYLKTATDLPKRDGAATRQEPNPMVDFVLFVLYMLTSVRSRKKKECRDRTAGLMQVYQPDVN
jgi:hypothetical protein